MYPDFFHSNFLVFHVPWHWAFINSCARTSRCGCLQIICELLQPLRKISQTVVRISSVIFFCFRFWWLICNQFPKTVPSLRSNTGLEDEHDESCGVVVEDELLPELADKPGTTRGTKLSVLHTPLSILDQSWILTHKSIHGLLKACPAMEKLAFPPVFHGY